MAPRRALALLLAAAAAQLATAHFMLEYPLWRADSLAQNTSFSQWIYPCANVPYSGAGANRTDVPVSGGLSLKLDLHHPWTYVFVNLGVGENVTNFNYTLTPGAMWNETGAGTLCLPSLPYPADFNATDGENGSLQVVTLGASGDALYNCADVTFRSNVAAFGGQPCTTDANVSVTVVNQQASNSTPSTNVSGGGGGGGAKNAAAAKGANLMALTTALGLAVAILCAA